VYEKFIPPPPSPLPIVWMPGVVGYSTVNIAR
jgi:hypothetical protein